MEKTYFDEPTQVLFADPDNPGYWQCGIAYKDEIICACCGGIFEINEIIEASKEDHRVYAIYPYKDWIDITADIVGGELPKGLMYDDFNNVLIETEKDSEENENEIEEEEIDPYFLRNDID